MSDPIPPKREGIFNNPQVLVAVIGGLVTIVAAVVGVLPTLVNPRTTESSIVVVTATSVPDVQPSSTPVPVQPTATETPLQPTLVQLELVVTVPVGPPTINPQATGNVSLMYDDDSFTLLNQGGQVLSLEGVTFRSSSGQWEARDWGVSIFTSIPSNNCVRLRDARVGDRLPPAPCRNNIYGLQLVGASALFWVNVNTFDVVRNGEVIATCEVSAGRCLVSL